MQKARDSFPDILRGFALLGIALVNLPLLSVDTVLALEGADLTDPTNSGAAFVVMAFFQAKFYLLFSFLFGYSAHYVIKGDKANRGRWIGRSIGLIILGILHFTFFFHGDILFIYGLFGLILLALYFRSEKTIRGWAWGIYIVVAVLFLATTALAWIGEVALAAKGKALPETAFASNLDAALSSGSFLDTVGPRLELWLLAAPNGFILQGPLVFAAFLVGVLVARKNGLVDVNSSLMNKLIVWGLVIGVPTQMLGAYIFISNSTGADSLGVYLLSLTINFLTAPFLSAAYLGLLWKLSTKVKLGLLSAAGKMSLTVYLGQSVIFSFIFSAWGLGLFGQLDLLQVSLVAVGVYLLLATFSMLYLRLRAKGPMESLLTGFSKLFERKS
jgi:uncharacterized protein